VAEDKFVDPVNFLSNVSCSRQVLGEEIYCPIILSLVLANVALMGAVDPASA
jgi:hypothetical protein